MTAATAPAASTGRPVLTFPVGDHTCNLYTVVDRCYVCTHGHVLRIAGPRSEQAMTQDLDQMRTPRRSVLRRVVQARIMSVDGALRHYRAVRPPDEPTTRPFGPGQVAGRPTHDPAKANGYDIETKVCAWPPVAGPYRSDGCYGLPHPGVQIINLAVPEPVGFVGFYRHPGMAWETSG